jgi:hypothetical protein
MTREKRLRQMKLAALKKARAALAKKYKQKPNGSASDSLDERIKARAKAIVATKMAAAISAAMEAYE